MGTEVRLDLIESNDELQARYYKLNGAVVYDYEEQMKAGDKFPPVVLFHDGERYWLADGFHRVAAARQMDAKYIDAEVHQGTQRDAMLYANGPANREHGLQLTRDDKRNRVDRMLQDDEWSQWSDRKIGKHCGVSHTFVAMRRDRLAPSGNVATPERHWGLLNGMAFWKMVEKLELDKATIISQLQQGANVLTDLSMTKDEAWQKLTEQGIRQASTRCPVDSTVFHLATRRVARVTGYNVSNMGLALKVFDLKQEVDEVWLADGIATATQYEIDSYLKPAAVETERPLSVVDVVITRSGHIGFVKHINGAFNIVTTVNGEQPHYRQDLTLIDLTDGALPKTLTEQQRTEFHILSAKQLAEWNERDADIQPEPEPNPFQVGDRVQWKDGRGNGTIRYLKGEKCGVNLDTSHTTHYYHWQELEYEVVAEQPAENDSDRLQWGDGQIMTEDEQAEYEKAAGWQQLSTYEAEHVVEVLPALKRLLDYSEGTIDLYQ
ncbi:partial Transcriptional regulator NovG, partial [Anaerolineae bacterium]